MSSISPIETKEFARKIEALRCNYLDAPVSGDEVGAKAASLTTMVGEKQEVLDRVKPQDDWRIDLRGFRAEFPVCSKRPAKLNAAKGDIHSTLSS
jgi:hypothetical protein